MPAAVIVAGVAAAGTIGASVISSNAQKKANAKAVDAATNATNTNNALTRDIYDQNRGNLSPFIQNGYGANNALAGLLGIGGGFSGGPDQAQLVGANGNMPAAANGNGYYGGGMGAPQSPYGEMDPGWTVGGQEAGTMLPTGQFQQVTGQQPVAGQPNALSPYQQAFQNYQNSTGYQFRFGEGMRALNSGYAAKGQLQSGAAQKAALRYGQDYGSNEFGNYLGYLGQQQGVGLSAGNALAGIGTNYAGMVSNNNNSLAGVQANAALANGQSTANMWGNVAGAVGNFAGAFGSSYGGPGKSMNSLYGKFG